MGWREDDARWEAEDEGRREEAWNLHEGHTTPDPECWICERNAAEDAAEAVGA